MFVHLEAQVWEHHFQDVWDGTLFIINFVSIIKRKLCAWYICWVSMMLPTDDSSRRQESIKNWENFRNWKKKKKKKKERKKKRKKDNVTHVSCTPFYTRWCPYSFLLYTQACAVYYVTVKTDINKRLLIKHSLISNLISMDVILDQKIYWWVDVGLWLPCMSN